MINIFVLFFLTSCSSSSQHTCRIDDVLNDFLNTDVSYSIDQGHVDLTNIFRDNKIPYIGFIGEKKKKIDIFITSIELDSKNPSHYLIEGSTQIYSEKTRHFIGKLLPDKQYKFSKKIDEDVSYSDSILKQDFSILTYELKENDSLNNAGIFKGNLLVSWYKDTSSNVHYDDTLDYIPSYTNCYFFGNWVNNDRDEKLITAWSHYRITCSGDLDIGAAEFSPNPKYYNQGWKFYNSEVITEENVIENSNDIIAKIIDEDGYVNMRLEKNKNSGIVCQVSSGSLVKVLNKTQEWWFVSYKNKIGYIHKSRLKLIKHY
ncbi:SH3 domain-containing protein [Tenacibaculum finnmarkense]|uniref:SH3 domain-containing protein n=1 Tax=Tenacibaculum finnmarkense TaxID=2781243 RepID=UPI001EFC1E02|nr:SH3 domain-containing protein [Tenacibaculum finnmarkense]MCG8186787.1 SH3 domain-containing protein [Tenacibaculum finnmarkense genomovar finnmarkense]MCG8210750.1 SH3 domain-containing protein [Tenacibaculum finnmarkense genomovar finnmarkense]MCG8729068.1 SH3 domain-containing protein [Tenacibaculum finnmarkense]MCG8760544.1 SH3 domain-containing protein [Tenacibaculum finnmarkense]MCG8768432.1 SH3 domain-containing protein [Tenacibaculum finnmarkense]